MHNKRGLSDIVTTLIIVLLSIVAIGVVWVVVKNVIDKGKENISLENFNLDLQIIGATVDADTLSVTVKRNSGGGELVGINFVIGDGTSSTVVRRDTTLTQLGIETFDFTLSQLAVGVITSISVAPIYLNTAGRETTGEILDTESYPSGSAGTGGGSGASGPGGSSPDGGGDDGGNGDPETGVCGDEIVQNPNSDGVNEICDGNNLNGQSCSSLGLGTGTLTCFASGSPNECTFDSSGCSQAPPPTCDGTWDQDDIDEGVNECDGTAKCQSNCLCEPGFGPDGTTGNCKIDPAINSGLVFATWPQDGNATRFKSPDIPQDQNELQTYTSYYINFSSSTEIRCFRIQSASYYSDVGSSEIELLINFLIEPLANIGQGQGYSVWEAADCGL